MNARKFITTHSIGNGFGKKKLIEAQKDIDESKSASSIALHGAIFFDTTLLSRPAVFKSPQLAFCFISLLVCWVQAALSGFQQNKTTISNTEGQASSFKRLPFHLI